jgi:hypothetical protein
MTSFMDINLPTSSLVSSSVFIYLTSLFFDQGICRLPGLRTHHQTGFARHVQLEPHGNALPACR